MVMVMSMRSMIVVEPLPIMIMVEPLPVMIVVEPFPIMIVVKPLPVVVIIPVVFPKPMEVLAGKVDISRPVPALIEHWLPVIETIPRPGADEHAVDKIVRSPVTVRSATERIVRVVSVRACGGNVIVAVVATDMDTDRNLGR